MFPSAYRQTPDSHPTLPTPVAPQRPAASMARSEGSWGLPDKTSHSALINYAHLNTLFFHSTKYLVHVAISYHIESSGFKKFNLFLGVKSEQNDQLVINTVFFCNWFHLKNQKELWIVLLIDLVGWKSHSLTSEPLSAKTVSWPLMCL
jgi:hypothetical protein